MRTASAASLKGRRRSRHDYPMQDCCLGRLCTAFLVKKGHAFQLDWELMGFRSVAAMGAAIAQLRMFYGMDIRVVSRPGMGNGKKGTGPAFYCLVGEWFGKVYIDYTQEENQGDQRRT